MGQPWLQIIGQPPGIFETISSGLATEQTGQPVTTQFTDLSLPLLPQSQSCGCTGIASCCTATLVPLACSCSHAVHHKQTILPCPRAVHHHPRTHWCERIGSGFLGSSWRTSNVLDRRTRPSRYHVCSANSLDVLWRPGLLFHLPDYYNDSIVF